MNMDSGKYEYLIQAIFDIVSQTDRITIGELTLELNKYGFSNDSIEDICNKMHLSGSINISDLVNTDYSSIRGYNPISVTYPAYDNRGPPSQMPYGNAVSSIIDSVQDIIYSAKEKIIILSPYIELDGLQYIEETLISKLKNGIEVTIIARELHKNDLRKEVLIDHIRDRFANYPTFSLYNYHYVSQSGHIDSTCHGKVVAADDNYAYLGSGDIRYRAFYVNLELGSIHKGYEAKIITSILEKIIDVSEKIIFD